MRIAILCVAATGLFSLVPFGVIPVWTQSATPDGDSDGTNNAFSYRNTLEISGSASFRSSFAFRQDAAASSALLGDSLAAYQSRTDILVHRDARITGTTHRRGE